MAIEIIKFVMSVLIVLGAALPFGYFGLLSARR